MKICWPLALLVLALHLTCFATVARANFDILDFSTAQQISLVGVATIAGTQLRLTPAQPDQDGAAWFDQALDLDQGFETSFTLRMSNPGGADGMAFVIQTDGPQAIGCLGGNPCGSSTLHQGAQLAYEGLVSVAVEFDSYLNGTEGDTSGNHISVHTQGMAPNDSNESASIGSLNNLTVDLNNGTTHAIKIIYTPGQLMIFLVNQQVPVLTVPLDLAAELGSGPKYVGFTAATGGLNETHEVHFWSLQTSNTSPDFVRGECNLDAAVNLGDAIFLLAYLFPQGAPVTLDCPDACDANDDGALNLTDAIVLLGSLFGMPIVPLMGPTTCGADPTDTDPLACLQSGCP